MSNHKSSTPLQRNASVHKRTMRARSLEQRRLHPMRAERLLFALLLPAQGDAFRERGAPEAGRPTKLGGRKEAAAGTDCK
eukprot:1035024-Prymnesium_polylepis.4